MNNTVLRSISGIGFVAITIACLIFNKFLFAGWIIFIEVVMMMEFHKMTMGNRYIFSRMLAIIAGVILFLLLFFACAYGLEYRYVALSILPMMIVMINSLYVKEKDEFWKFSFIYTSILYIAIPLAFANVIAFDNQVFNGLPMLSFFIIIWASDVGAYVFGVTLGQKFGKKLFPEISPKKSWIGFWGGMLASVIASVLLRIFGFIEYPIINCILLAIIMDVSGVYGDLFESQWKRCYNIKDSGSIIPGHGGMLDRFDSSLFAIPMGVLYLVIFNLM